MAEVWNPKEHSQIKESILEKYLAVWYMKITYRFRRAYYVDTCSGPGVFDSGMQGSPMIALKNAFKAWEKHPSCVYEFVFCDANADVLRRLEENVTNYLSSSEKGFSGAVRIRFHECDFLEQFDKILNEAKKNRTAAFLFIDPFNASTVPFDAIVKAMKGTSTEVLFNFMHSDINRNKRLMNLEKTERIMGKGYDQEKLKSVSIIRDSFVSDLRERTGAYVMYYTMKISSKAPLYDLIHLTKHCHGLSIMKEVMSSLSKSPHYFSNDERYAKDQLTILVQTSQDSFYEVLKNICGSGEVRVERLYDDIVCDDTLFWTKSSILSQLRDLISSGRIELVAGPKTVNKNSIIRITEET